MRDYVDSKLFITGTRRGLGKALSALYNTVDTLEECDVFVNCKHNGFEQVDMLYKATDLNKRVISIGSYASDFVFHPHKPKFNYAVEKKALRDANSALFDHSKDVTCINFGYFDSPRVEHVNAEKMSIEYCISVFDWILRQPHRIKDITVCP
jgi:hypothetical protein